MLCNLNDVACDVGQTSFNLPEQLRINYINLFFQNAFANKIDYIFILYKFNFSILFEKSFFSVNLISSRLFRIQFAIGSPSVECISER